MRKFNSSDIEIYLTSLRDEVTPFDVFVSKAGRAAIEDKIDLATPRSRVTRVVRRTLSSVIQDKVTRFIPIVGAAGSGKTHFYWYLNEEEKSQIEVQWVACYIPSPPSSVRIPLHLYTSILDEIGEDLLMNSSENLIKRNSNESDSIQEIITKCVRKYPGLGSDAIKGLVLYRKGNSTEKNLAERWLLGETLGEEELETLGLSRIIEDDDFVTKTMNSIFENYDKTVILYFDELEIPYRTLGKSTASAFVEHLKRMYNEMRNILIITACLSNIWPEIYESLDDAMKSRLETEATLLPFSLKDVQSFYEDSMKIWWIENQNIVPPNDLLFPLSSHHFVEIMEESKGNPRNTIKTIRNKLDNIINLRLEGEKEGIDTHISKADLAILNVGQNVDISNDDLSLISKASEIDNLTPEQMEILENVTIEINPSSIAAGVVSAIKTISNIILEENCEFEFKNKMRILAIKVIYNNKQIGIEIPSVKNFDKRGGVASYYALNRLIEALSIKKIDRGILFIPLDTSGKKYQYSLKTVQNYVKTIKLSQNDAESLIKGGLIKQLSPKSIELVNTIKEIVN